MTSLPSVHLSTATSICAPARSRATSSVGSAASRGPRRRRAARSWGSSSGPPRRRGTLPSGCGGSATASSPGPASAPAAASTTMRCHAPSSGSPANEAATRAVHGAPQPPPSSTATTVLLDPPPGQHSLASSRSSSRPSPSRSRAAASVQKRSLKAAPPWSGTRSGQAGATPRASVRPERAAGATEARAGPQGNPPSAAAAAAPPPAASITSSARAPPSPPPCTRFTNERDSQEQVSDGAQGSPARLSGASSRTR